MRAVVIIFIYLFIYLNDGLKQFYFLAAIPNFFIPYPS